jgi:hypothetical protein
MYVILFYAHEEGQAPRSHAGRSSAGELRCLGRITAHHLAAHSSVATVVAMHARPGFVTLRGSIRQGCQTSGAPERPPVYWLSGSVSLRRSSVIAEGGVNDSPCTVGLPAQGALRSRHRQIGGLRRTRQVEYSRYVGFSEDVTFANTVLCCDAQQNSSISVCTRYMD